MKAPKNYYNTVDQAKLGLDQIDKNKKAIEDLQDLPVLPTPAAGDTGKVVKVGSDGYELAGDEGARLVTATVTADGQGNLSCDKTYAVLTAYLAIGDIVELAYRGQTFVYSGIDPTGIHFVLAKNDSNGHNVITAWTISSSDVITFLIDEINSELPTVTSVDAGKVLSVYSNGDWGLGERDVFYVDASIDSASSPTKITLNGMSRTDLINSAALYKEHIIVAKTADEKNSLFFHQFRDNNDPVQRSLNFFSFGTAYGAVDRIYSCAVLPSPSSEINILTKTLA